MEGLLIAICGLDGAGKTTQITLLSKWFEKKNMLFKTTKQPTDTYRNDSRVRDYLDNGECPDMKALAMLAAADRKWHIKTVIEPNLNKGIHVITDRYLYSSIAFFNARGLNPNLITELNRDVRKPDITIYIDVEPTVSLERISFRDGNKLKYEERSADIFIKVRNSFLNKSLPKDAIIVDGTLSQDFIHERICSEVEYVIKNRVGEFIGPW